MQRHDFFGHVATVLFLEGHYRLARYIGALSRTFAHGARLSDAERQRIRRRFRNDCHRERIFAVLDDFFERAYRSLLQLFCAVASCEGMEWAPAHSVAEGYKMLSRTIRHQHLEEGYRYYR